MLGAFLTTIFVSISVICANQSAKLIGGSEANFWRLTCATGFLAIWAYTFGKGLSSEAFPIFFLSGIIGIGIGDVAVFQTLPRLGSRLTLLLVQCLTAPFAAAIERLWLGTTLTPAQMICGATILIGIGISLMPGRHLNLSRKDIVPGMLFSLIAALGGAYGAVLSRKAYATLHEHGDSLDGGTAAFQRVLGGLLIGGLSLLAVKWRTIKQHLSFSSGDLALPSREKWRRVWPWVLANSLAGQTIGISCYLWALQTTPTGIVLPIVATTPLVAIPFSMAIEKERPSRHSIIGGVIAVAGVIALSFFK